MKIIYFSLFIIILCFCDIYKVNASNYYNKTSVTGLKRNGKFLFDALFGLQPVVAINDDDDDEEENATDFKKCDCGMFFLFKKCC